MALPASPDASTPSTPSSDLGLFVIVPLTQFSDRMTELAALSATTSSSSTELANRMAQCESDLETSFVSTLKTHPHATLSQLLLHAPPLSDFVRQDVQRIYTLAQATASLWRNRAYRSTTPPRSDPPTAPPKLERTLYAAWGLHPPAIKRAIPETKSPSAPRAIRPLDNTPLPPQVCLLCVHRFPPQDCPPCFLKLVFNEF